MAWYAAHAILYLKLKAGQQDRYPVWENIYLVAGDTANDALVKAMQCGEADAGDSDGTFTWNEQPAEWLFAGIRKLVAVAHVNSGDTLSSGDEITYSEFELENLDAVMRLASGGRVQAEYVD